MGTVVFDSLDFKLTQPFHGLIMNFPHSYQSNSL